MTTDLAAVRRRRVGIFGGTLDPIHSGHLCAASEVMGKLGLDEVIFVPTGVPSHKIGQDVTAAEHRYTMVQLAIASNPRFSASRVDLDRGKPTYTFDTLTDLRAELGDDVELFFITGADVVAAIPTWKNADGLFDLAHFVAVSRPDHEVCLDGLPAGKVTACHTPALAMSSTEIRRRVAADEPVWYWMPDTVLTYIGKHHLYGADWS